jgi:hypothetical protein
MRRRSKILNIENEDEGDDEYEVKHGMHNIVLVLEDFIIEMNMQ